jgi:phosphotransferase system enzyme I (PtsI)
VKGLVILEPGERLSEEYQGEIKRRQEWQTIVGKGAQEDAYTADGRRVEVGANIGDIETAKRALESGAEGVGLLRTEFLYLGHTKAPNEEAQVKAYRQIFETLSPRPVIVRTLDIGGDKPPTYMEFPEELNPFLGWRAIRIGLEDETLLKTQLRAILRAAVGHNAHIMYPMISSVEELEGANQLLAQAQDELSETQIPYAVDVPVGVMIETPAAALIANLLAARCDFLSIGTNDLTQYTLAVDRTNERVAHLFQPLHPSVLRLIKHTIEAGHDAGIWVGMCGEMAGMLQGIPILVGFGLDEFSMAPSSIPEAKWLIRKLTVERASQIASDVLNMGTAAEIEKYMGDILEIVYTG